MVQAILVGGQLGGTIVTVAAGARFYVSSESIYRLEPVRDFMIGHPKESTLVETLSCALVEHHSMTGLDGARPAGRTRCPEWQDQRI